MFDWRQIIAGVVAGAILGICGTFFVFQGRVARLEANIGANKHHSFGEGLGNSSPLSNPLSPQDWSGQWQHTEVIIGESFTGKMELTASGLGVKGWSENSNGGITEIVGTVSKGGEILRGEWTNTTTGQRGSLRFYLLSTNVFQGNYALEGKPIRDHVNSWVGFKVKNES